MGDLLADLLEASLILESKKTEPSYAEVRALFFAISI